ncbi:hypothetical protein FACS1894188_05290 [Clostridia bacterium]|nr:hypothetical protein FACS1894188_05290 [Clostridia bacterium]
MATYYRVYSEVISNQYLGVNKLLKAHSQWELSLKIKEEKRKWIDAEFKSQMKARIYVDGTEPMNKVVANELTQYNNILRQSLSVNHKFNFNSLCGYSYFTSFRSKLIEPSPITIPRNKLLLDRTLQSFYDDFPYFQSKLIKPLPVPDLQNFYDKFNVGRPHPIEKLIKSLGAKRIEKENIAIEAYKEAVKKYENDLLDYNANVELEKAQYARQKEEFAAEHYKAAVTTYETALADYNKELDSEKARYEQESAVYIKKLDSEKAQYAQQKLDFERKQSENNAKVHKWRRDFERGKQMAVERYILVVAASSQYPRNISQNIDVDYNAKSKTILVSFYLPDTNDFDYISDYKYIASTKKIVPRKMNQKEQAKFYDNVISQLILRAIYEIFDSIYVDGIVEYVEIKGIVNNADIVSVKAERKSFGNIDLANVDPKECLKTLGVVMKKSFFKVLETENASDWNGSIVEIDGTEQKGVAIPPRGGIKSKTLSSAKVKIYESNNHNLSYYGFLTAAQNYSSNTVLHAPFVPFMCYWPQYSSMTAEQQNWYFYWRTEIRKNNYLKTDLSYIFLYVYELINGVGFDNPALGYNKLTDIWKFYRVEFPNLDNYLVDWIFDFILVHEIVEVFLDYCGFLNNLGCKMGYKCYNLYVNRRYIEAENEFLAKDVMEISAHDIKRSKLYTDENALFLEEKFKEVLTTLNDYSVKNCGKNIFALFCPQKRETERYDCYQNAVYYKRAKVTLNYFNFSYYVPFKDFATSVIKYTENKLREQYGISGRLRNIVLDDAYKKCIDDVFAKPKITNAPALSLDLQVISRLREESNAVREMLKSEDDLEENPIAPPIAETDFSFTNDENAVIQKLIDNADGCDASELSDLLANGMIDLIIDDINAKALDTYGNIMISSDGTRYYIEEDYKNEGTK